MFALALARRCGSGAGRGWTLTQAHRAALLATRATMVGKAAGEAAGGALSTWGPGRPAPVGRPDGRGAGAGAEAEGAPLARRESEVIDVDARDVTVTTAPLRPAAGGLARPAPRYQTERCRRCRVNPIQWLQNIPNVIRPAFIPFAAVIVIVMGFLLAGAYNPGLKATIKEHIGTLILAGFLVFAGSAALLGSSPAPA